MKRYLAVTGLLLGILAGNAAPALAEEELFDTKAAAELLDKGVSHLNAKEYDAAIEELEEATSIAPDAEAFYYLGYAYYMKSKKGDGDSRQKAIESFEKAYDINPNFTPSKFKPAEPVTPEELQAQERAAEPQPPAPPAAPAEPAPPAEPQTQAPTEQK